ncbi:MAG: phage-shock protein [bacterium]|nr:phage-shock protein [bacterium]
MLTEVITVIGMFIVLIVCAVTVAITTVLRNARDGRSPESNAAEAQMIQDMHRSMMKMEERVESLETILLERERK